MDYTNPIPDELALLLSQKFKGAYMPSLQILRNKVEGFTSHYLISYISFSTGKSRRTQTYICRHSKTKYKCQAKLYIEYDSDNHLATFMNIDQMHNHKFEKESYKRMRNTLTQYQREKIVEATRFAISSQNLRISLNLSCTKDVLYGLRRKVITDLKENEMSNMIKEIEHHDNWSNIILSDDQNKLESIYIVHDRVAENDYVNDIIIVDDTSCTNYYGLPLVALIAIDENNRNQLLSFALISSREQTSFANYFVKVKEKIGDIRLFVTDRNLSQINAIKEVWPNAFIIYCHRHIAKNILDKVGIEMYNNFQNMINLKITEEQLLDRFTEYIQENEEGFGAKVLENLIKEKDHWLPSIILTYTHLGNDTTNRVEGFFGSLKSLTEHRVLNLQFLLRALFLKGDSLLKLSAGDQQLFSDEFLMNEEESKKIGNFPFSVIYAEYLELISKGSLSTEYSDCCCKIHMLYGLPCRHLLLQRLKEEKNPLLCQEDVPKRWCRGTCDGVIPQTPAILTRERSTPIIDTSKNWDYTSCIHKFEKYFSNAKRDDRIREILDNALIELSSIQHQNDTNEEILPPNNLLIPGAPKTHPRKNVDQLHDNIKIHGSGAPRIKKQYRCSICHSTNHTAPRCPNNTDL